MICLGPCSAEPYNEQLPSLAFSASTAFVFWDDLSLEYGSSQNIWVDILGTEPNRMTTFEFYTSRFNNATQFYHFQVQFYEHMPGIVRYTYYEIADGGASATIGTQCKYF